METIRIYTLGQLRMERNDDEWLTVADAEWHYQRVRLLLRSLVSFPRRSADRAILLTQAWSSLEPERASGRLDRAVHDLRRIFEPSREKPFTSPLLLTHQGTVALADQCSIWIDADAFEQALGEAHACEGAREKEGFLQEARSLYQGDFLPDDPLNTAVQRRTHLFHCMIALLLELAHLQMQREAFADAVDSLRQLLMMDPAHETAAQFLMQTLARMGQRAEALRVYKRLSTALQQSHHVVPSRETRALYDTICSGIVVCSEPLESACMQETLPLLSFDITQEQGMPSYPYEFIDVLRDRTPHKHIALTLFDNEAVLFFLQAVLHDAVHFPPGSTFQFQAFHPDAPSSPHLLLPDMPVGTALLRKHAQSIEAVTTTGILTPLIVNFGFTNAKDASLWQFEDSTFNTSGHQDTICGGLIS